MNRWLLKTEPSEYSFADLQRDGATTWDGISNAAALKHLRAMRSGDAVLIYHTGSERQAVGLATVASDPNAPADDPKLATVDIKAGKQLKRPVTLAEIKADPTFAGFDLVRISRLSVMPVPRDLWDRILKMAGA